MNTKQEIRWVFDALASLHSCKCTMDDVAKLAEVDHRVGNLLDGIKSGEIPFSSEDLIVLSTEEAKMALGLLGMQLATSVAESVIH